MRETTVNSIISESCLTGSEYWEDIEKDIQSYYPNWSKRKVKGGSYLRLSDLIQVSTDGKYTMNCRHQILEINYKLFDKSMLKDFNF